MRELFFQLEKAGFICVFRDGGITVTLGLVTIVLGDDEGTFMAYVQEDLESGPKHTSLDGLSQADAIELCQSYPQSAPAATIAPTEGVEPLVVG
jgi:hypothetical protein